ncbi:MAG: hypothetical protein NZ992_04845 [Candidatus Korarchaeum sp.]|nr:hypothetical protein [Candidatus Korarchaeum sp.]MDW8035256.1 hypothetical protein [Candidatus Korarchaeum sp.]
MFKSTFRSDYRVTNDIDVAITLKEIVDGKLRVNFKSLVRKELGLLTPSSCMRSLSSSGGLYRRFVKDGYVKVRTLNSTPP